MNMKRYGKATDVLPREVILLRGSGCVWGRCSFCDYCDDKNNNVMKNFTINKREIDKLTGEFGIVQCIDSGSFFELDIMTIMYLRGKLKELKVRQLVIECHSLYIPQFKYLKDIFGEKIEIKIIVGAESLDIEYREKVLNKGMGNISAEELAKHFNWINIMFGMEGQTLDMLEKDVRLALMLFERVTINVFCNNRTAIKRDYRLIDEFYNSSFFEELISDKYRNRVEILDDFDKRSKCTLDLVGSKLK